LTGPTGPPGPQLGFASAEDISTAADTTRNFATTAGELAWLNNFSVDRSSDIRILESGDNTVFEVQPGTYEFSFHTTWAAKDANPDIALRIDLVNSSSCAASTLLGSGSSLATTFVDMILNEQTWYSASGSSVRSIGSTTCLALRAREDTPQSGNRAEMVRGTVIIRRMQ
jgi:hypothetical protein